MKLPDSQTPTPWRERALLPVLVFVTMVAAVISSLGAPLIPSISLELHVPLSTAQWSLTVALLAGAVSAPIMGRLGDGPHQRTTLIGGLAAVTAGGIVAALATNLPELIVGRLLQGVALGLVPLTIAAAREHLPGPRVPAAIALLSVCAAAGVGAGYPISGVIADRLGGLSAAFWFGAIVSGLALLCVLMVVPESSSRDTRTLDIPGALVLAFALVALLVAIAEGNAWGWSSPLFLGLLIAAGGLGALWIGQQLRVHTPLVDLRLLRHPTVLTADVCALVLGTAMYMYLSGLTEYVQTPRSEGYGFSSTIVVAGLCLVPFSIFSLTASRALPLLSRAFGDRAVLPLGSLVVAACGAFFGAFHDALWQAFGMSALLGVGLGLTFAAIPGLIVRSVPERETGSAMGFYQVVRYIGFSLGSALAAAILAARTNPDAHLPTEGGYLIVFWIGAAISVAAAALAWLLPERSHGRIDPRLTQFVEEDAELASAGLAGPRELDGAPVSVETVSG
jgi:MFS family permease